MTRIANVEQGIAEAERKARNPNGTRGPEEYRRSYLPIQLAAARRKVEMLEREAKRLGMVL